MKEEVKEIDLVELFIKFLHFIRVNFKLLVLIGIAGIILGLVYYFTRPTRYEYKVYGTVSDISPEVFIKSIDDFNSYLKHNDVNNVTNQYSLNQDKVNPIKNIEASLADEETNNVQLTIICNKKLSEQETDSLVSGILLNNTFVVEQLNYRKQELQKTIAFIDKQIENYSVIHSSQGNSTGNGILFSAEETPTTLYLRRNSLEYQLKYLEPFIIKNYPKQPKNPTGPIYFYGLAGFFILQLLFMLMMAIRQVNKLAIEYENKNLQIIKYNKTA